MEITTDVLVGGGGSFVSVLLFHPLEDRARSIDGEHDAANVLSARSILEVLELLAQQLVQLDIGVLAVVVAVESVTASIAGLGVILAATGALVGGLVVGHLGVGGLGVRGLGVGHLGSGG